MKLRGVASKGIMVYLREPMLSELNKLCQTYGDRSDLINKFVEAGLKAEMKKKAALMEKGEV